MRKRDQKLVATLLGGASLLLLLAVVANRLITRPPPPPKEDVQQSATPAPPPPPPRCSQLFYLAAIKNAAQAYRVPEPTLEQLRQPLTGGTEFHGAHVLRPGIRGLETAHLQITAEVVRLAATNGAEGYRADNLVLAITNRTDTPLAYRVATEITAPDKCGLKAELPHNAIALRPHQTVRRTECLYHARQKLTVVQVDAYELTELGQRLVSRLVPSEGGPFDMRVARSHDPGGPTPCRSLPWRDLSPETDNWRTVIDFHARHDCDEYSLPRSYQPWTAPGALPVCTR